MTTVKSSGGVFRRAAGLLRSTRASQDRKRRAQTTVELMLVLPIFCLMIFLCMELGNIAHNVILVNHAAYELARIGSLVAGPKGGEPDSTPANDSKARAKMQAALVEMFPSYHGKITMTVTKEYTMTDPQAVGHQNEDLMVKLDYPVELMFPVANYILADGPNKQQHIMMVHVSMRMPIEKPMFH